MKQLAYSIAAAFCALLLTAPAAASGPTLKSLESGLAHKGAKATVRDLQSGKAAGWKFVIAQISGGKGEWIALVPRLRQGADAGLGEDLTYALSLALLRNPAAVLSVSAPDLPPRRICSVPYIEPTDAQIKTYTSKAEQAVRAVTGASLQERRRECLDALRQP